VPISASQQPPEVHVNRAFAFMRAGNLDQAHSEYEAALHADPEFEAAHWGLYELEQMLHNIPKALEHQRRLFERRTLFSDYAPQEERRVLALLGPGDWQANVPIDFLVDRTTTLHKLYVVSSEQIAKAQIPEADVVFVAVGESDEAQHTLALVSELLPRIGLPYINDPHKIAATNRLAVAQALAPIANVHAPRAVRVSHADLQNGTPFGFPIVVRPVGSQAGRDLARVENERELNTYLESVASDAFYVMPFVDFRSADGYFRKYRIIVVEGTPYPYHLAISANWMIHYYNTPMYETAWMREEEAAFLADFERVFPAPLRRALRDVASAVGLEYFGIDCSIDAQGKLLVFEADPAMIVHAGDDPALFGYKKLYAHRIFDAFQRLLDHARSR
jgi:glutathione synthase/RimK-type ligase-like ATP-grasp enzyme